MAIGARPLDERAVVAIIDGKMRDFRSVAGRIEVRHLRLDPYVETAATDPDVELAVQSGFIAHLASDLRDPVMVRTSDRKVFTCPPLAVRVLHDEPPEIHRAFVEGVFFRKLFRFFVPAAHEGGASWEAAEQVREIMQRHFAMQLVVAETLLDRAA